MFLDPFWFLFFTNTLFSLHPPTPRLLLSLYHLERGMDNPGDVTFIRTSSNNCYNCENCENSLTHETHRNSKLQYLKVPTRKDIAPVPRSQSKLKSRCCSLTAQQITIRCDVSKGAVTDGMTSGRGVPYHRNARCFGMQAPQFYDNLAWL